MATLKPGSLVGSPVHDNGDCSGSEWALTVGEVYGYKTFNRDHKGRLTSPQKHFVWKRGKNTAFEIPGDKTSVLFNSRYQPGFFAYYDKPSWDGEVRGMIKAYGHVSEGTRGFHAQFAEVYAVVQKRGKSLLGRTMFDFYANSSWSTMAGIGIPAAVLGIVSTVAAVITAFSGVPLAATILLPLAVLFVSVAYHSFRAEDSMNTIGGKRRWRESTYQHTLKDIYPQAKVYRSVLAMRLANNRLVNSSKPAPEPIPVISPDEEEFWKD